MPIILKRKILYESTKHKYSKGSAFIRQVFHNYNLFESLKMSKNCSIINIYE